VSHGSEQGSTLDLTEAELDVACDTLVKVAATLDADSRLIHKKRLIPGGWMGIVMMRKRADTVEALEIRVACTYHSVAQLMNRCRKRRCRKEYTVGYT
jgi:hypothetical protein